MGRTPMIRENLIILAKLNFMSVFRHNVAGDKSGVNLQYAPKAASTVIAENRFLTRDAAGRLIPAEDTAATIVGVSVTRVTAADGNYAATSEIAYDEPREGDVFLVDVDDAGTAGFVPGVSRALLESSAGATVKAAAIAGDDVATVVIKKVFTDTDQALVTIKTPTL